MKYRIFVSGVQKELKSERLAVQEMVEGDALLKDYFRVFLFEKSPAGSLPSQLSIADLKKPHRSYPGNPLIAEVFYLANYIQKVGSGTIEMVKQCKQAGLPEPEFVNNRGYEFRTILGRDLLTESALIRLGLNERQLKAVKYVKEKGRITNREYRDLTGLKTDRTALRDLVMLCKKRIFEKTASTGRNTVYYLTRHKPDKSDKSPT